MTDKELFELCQRKGAIARKTKYEFLALIPEVYKRGLHRKRGFGSIFEFAAKLGGVSRKNVESVLQLEKHIQDKPALKELVPRIGVNKLRVIATMATQNNQKELAEKVQSMSKPALELFARSQKESPPGRSILSFHVEPEVELELRKLKAEGETFNDVMKKLLAMVPKEKEIKPRNVRESKSRPVPAQKRREALAKTNGKCVIEGCNRPATQIHHKKPWAIYQSHNVLEPLCKDHHELAHQSDSTIDQKFRQRKMQGAMF